MKTNHNWLKITEKLGLFLMIGVSMSACSATWKEEALQNDGSTIMVERSVERGGRHEIGQEPPIKQQSLSFTMPNTNQTVTWEDKYSEDVGGASFLPMMLAVSKDIAYLVVNPMGCLSYNKWGRPNQPYVVFKYQNNTWQRILLSELPIEYKQLNLAFSEPDGAAKEAIHGVLTVAQIRKWNSDGVTQPEYRTILRTPVFGRDSESSCINVVSDGRGGWLGIDWFTNQTTLDGCLNVCRLQSLSPQYCPCNSLFKGK